MPSIMNSDSEEESTSAFRSEKFSMPAQTENALVQWFSEHPEFYVKSHRRYADKVYKDKQLAQIAAQVDEPADKINGWFRNQRTAVGKVYKHKSGQAPETLTKRKAWQVKAFSFLKEHITPRSYMSESTVIPSTERSASRASNENSGDEDSTSVSVCDVQTEKKVSAQPKRKSRRVDDALLEYLSRPRPSDNIAQQLESLAAPQDERAAFGQWLLSRIAKVPDEKWEQFQRAAFDLVLTWTRPLPAAPQNQPQQHVQGYTQPYQQPAQGYIQSYEHAQGYSQGFTPQFQQRQPQGFNQQVQPQIQPRAQSTPPVLLGSPQVYPSTSGLQSTQALGTSQLSEFSFAPTGFLHAMQSSEDVDKTDAGEEVASEGGD